MPEAWREMSPAALLGSAGSSARSEGGLIPELPLIDDDQARPLRRAFICGRAFVSAEFWGGNRSAGSEEEGETVFNMAT